ncbi:MAG: extracellular solute-binding protein [Acidobacteria bacterium]|nr:extracellular solute-binding protein [Acidobacteriota bacterium]
MRSATRAITLASIVVLLAAGCSSTPNASTTTTAPTAAATAGPTAAPATPAATATPTAAPSAAPTASATAAPEASGVPIPTDTTPVTIDWWVNPAFQNAPGVEDLTKEFGDWERYQADQFAAMHPNVTINIQVVPYQDFTVKLSAAFQAGLPPDIMRTGWQRQTSVLYEVPDEYEDLSLLVPDAYARLTDYFKGISHINGVVKLLPFTGGSVSGIAVNTGILKEIGVDYPEDGIWTREDFENICAKAVKPNERWCVAMQVANPTLEPLGFFWAGGAQYLNPDLTEVVINSPEGVETLDWLVSLKTKGWLLPGESTATYSDDSAAFRDGTVVFAVGWGYVSSIPFFDTLGPAPAGWEFNLLPYPQKSGVKNGGMTLQPSGFAVTKQSDPLKKAWIAAFLDYVMSPEYLAQYQVAGSAVPVVDNPPPATGPYADVLNRQAKWVETLGLNDLAVSAHNFSKLVTSFFPEMQAAFLGKKSAKQALDDYTASGNAFLKAP